MIPSPPPLPTIGEGSPELQLLESLLKTTLTPAPHQEFFRGGSHTLRHGPLLRSRPITVHREYHRTWSEVPPEQYQLEDDGRLVVCPAGSDHEIAYWTGYDLSADPLSPMAQQIVDVARSLTDYVADPMAANVLSRRINKEYSITISRSALADRDDAVLEKVQGLGAALGLGLTTPSYLLDRTAAERAAMFGVPEDEPQAMTALLGMAGVVSNPPAPQLVKAVFGIAGVADDYPAQAVTAIFGVTGVVGDRLVTPSSVHGVLNLVGAVSWPSPVAPITAILEMTGIAAIAPTPPPVIAQLNLAGMVQTPLSVTESVHGGFSLTGLVDNPSSTESVHGLLSLTGMTSAEVEAPTSLALFVAHGRGMSDVTMWDVLIAEAGSPSLGATLARLRVRV
ncbi:MAG: hypothetical protein AAGF75_11030 [Cyanobacteria bacterium P01_H01_bin.130]